MESCLILGVSSPQLEEPARGFSFQGDGPLDMRMDQSMSGTAADLVNRWPEAQLADTIFQFGEERFSRRIARAIVRARERHLLATTKELVSVIEGAVPANYRHGRLHCATRTFQAIRIAVNHELDCLEPSVARCGRCVVSRRSPLCDFIPLARRSDCETHATCALRQGRSCIGGAH